MIKQKIKLAVYFDQELSAGGGYQQALNSLLLLKNLNKNLLQVNYYTDKKSSVEFLINHEINTKLIKLTLYENIERKIRRNIKSKKILSLWKFIFKYNSFEKAFIKDNIDLLYFLSPSPLAAELEKINYIITIWDNCHRDHPEFPEVRESLIFEQREWMYHKILPKAFSILVDSSLGKQNIMRRYGIDDEKIHIMPFSGALMSKPNDIDYCESYISDKYDLYLPYVFYPAQFWPHKNHILILEAINHLEQNYRIKIGAIFSGGDKGNIEYIKQVTSDLSLINRVKFAGFVSNDEMYLLYSNSVALVMPTFFGPTNLPPLEAFNIGVPVLCSNIPGVSEQVGDAALLFDLSSPQHLSNCLYKLFTTTELRNILINKGYSQLAKFTDQNRIEIINSIINSFLVSRKTWQ